MSLLAALAIALPLSLGAGPAQAPAAPQDETAEPDPALPRSGSPQDLATWKAMREDLHQVQIQRALAHRLYYRLRPEVETTALTAIAKEHAGESERIDPLEARLYAARKLQYDMMAAIWPVDPRRACRAEMEDLKVAMEALPGPDREKGLESARVQANVCTEKLRSALIPLTQVNEELLAALAEVEAYLAKAPKVAATPPAANTPVEGKAGDEAAEHAGHAEHRKPDGGEAHEEHEARERAPAR